MSCCCAVAKWKREEVHDHKFDFIDINQFYESSLLRKLQYSMIFLIVLKSVLVYIADLWTAGILLFFNNWQSVQPKIPLEVAKFIYLLCILCSYLLLIWDGNKAIAIVKSRDIGLAYTSPMAYRYYVLRNYAHYCFFSKINNSKKLSDDLSFFVFFTLKGWKRIIFAEAPRQVVNGFTIYAILTDNPSGRIDFLEVYRKADLNDNPTPFLALCLMVFVFVVFVISAVLIFVALIVYFPLLCSVRGNLKEFCCHKIDKRIGEMLKKESRKRIAKEARKDLIGSLENGSATTQPTLPTLPDVEFDPQFGFNEYDYGGQAEAYYSPRMGPVGPSLGRDPSLRYDDRSRNMSVISSASSQYYNQPQPFNNAPRYMESPRMGPSGPGPYQNYAPSSRSSNASSIRGPPMGPYLAGNPVSGPRRGNFP